MRTLLQIPGKRVKVNGLRCAAAGVCTCSAACKVQKMSPAERLGGSWWGAGAGGGRKENQNKPQNNQRRVKAAAAQEAGGLQVITSCLGTLWQTVAFSSQGKLAHSDRKHLTTLARSLVFFLIYIIIFIPSAAAASAFTAFTLTFIVVFARVFSPTVYFGQSLGC